MIVELKSLLPAPEENLEKSVSLFREALSPRLPLTPEPEPPPQFAAAEANSGDSSPDSLETASENPLAYLLEQLIQYSEKNAASTEKIADLLESRESTPVPVYN